MLNHIDIAGRMVKEPEMRRTGNGVAVTSFTLAVDRDMSKDKETDFLEVVCWRNTAEFVNSYGAKGRLTIVSGRLQIRKWEDKNGNKRNTAEIVADSVYFADSKKDSGEKYEAAKNAQDQDFAVLDGDNDDLPFRFPF